MANVGRKEAIRGEVGLSSRHLGKELTHSSDGQVDGLPKVDGWAKPVKIARWRSPIHLLAISGERGSGAGPGIVGQFGPLGLGMVELGRGEEEDEPRREGVMVLG